MDDLIKRELALKALKINLDDIPDQTARTYVKGTVDKIQSRIFEIPNREPTKVSECIDVLNFMLRKGIITKGVHSIITDNLNKWYESGNAYWIDMGDFEQCSLCGGTHLKEFNSYYGNVYWIKSAYCPSCGAKMINEAIKELEEKNEFI